MSTTAWPKLLAFASLVKGGIPDSHERTGLAPRHLQPAPLGSARYRRRDRVRAAAQHRPRAGPLRHLQLNSFRSRSHGLRIRLQPRLSRSAGSLGSAIRRLRQRRASGHRPVRERGRRQVGTCSPASSFCCRMATKARARNTPARASSASCNSRPATISRSASRRTPRSISTCCAARRCVTGASRWSSSRRRACSAIPTPALRSKTSRTSASCPSSPTRAPKTPSAFWSAPEKSATNSASSASAAKTPATPSSSSTSCIRSHEPELKAAIDRHPDAREIVWVQEEPANMGALFYMMPRLRHVAGDRAVLSVKRSPSPSPSTGSAGAHEMEQKTLITLALTGGKS